MKPAVDDLHYLSLIDGDASLFCHLPTARLLIFFMLNQLPFHCLDVVRVLVMCPGVYEGGQQPQWADGQAAQQPRAFLRQSWCVRSD